jgi:hypothetical protein
VGSVSLNRDFNPALLLARERCAAVRPHRDNPRGIAGHNQPGSGAGDRWQEGLPDWLYDAPPA